MLRICWFMLLIVSFSSIVRSDKKQKDDESRFKFYQTGYKIVHDRLEVEKFDKTWVSHTNIYCYWYNRTARPINFTISILKDLSNVKLGVQLYKFLSNEYRYFPLAFDFNFCSALEQDVFDFKSVRNCGNIYTHCDYKKGHTYRFCNWLLDSTKFPPYIPFGKYKLNIMLKMGPATIASYFWFGSIEEIIKWD